MADSVDRFLATNNIPAAPVGPTQSMIDNSYYDIRPSDQRKIVSAVVPMDITEPPAPVTPKPVKPLLPDQQPIGILEATGKGIVSGLTGVASEIGTGMQWLGGRLGAEDLTELGKDTQKYWEKAGKQFELPAELNQDIIDHPEQLLSLPYWGYNVSKVITEMVPAIVAGITTSGASSGVQLLGKAYKWSPKMIEAAGKIAPLILPGLIGGAQEGTQTYQEVLKRGGTEQEAARAMEAMTTGSGLLNAISFGKMFEKIPDDLKSKVAYGFKRFLSTGAIESGTEYLEEPVEILIKLGLTQRGMTKEEVIGQLKSGLNIVPISFVTGGLGGVTLGEKPTVVKQDQPVDLLTGQPITKAAPEEAQAATQEDIYGDLGAETAQPIVVGTPPVVETPVGATLGQMPGQTTEQTPVVETVESPVISTIPAAATVGQNPVIEQAATPVIKTPDQVIAEGGLHPAVSQNLRDVGFTTDEMKNMAPEEAQKASSVIDQVKNNFKAILDRPRPGMDATQLSKAQHIEGIQQSAIKRKIFGHPTNRELESTVNRLNTNYTGKQVTVEGVPAKVHSVTFGKVNVEFENGVVRSYKPEMVQAPVATKEDGIAFLQQEGVKAYKDMLELHKSILQPKTPSKAPVKAKTEAVTETVENIPEDVKSWFIPAREQVMTLASKLGINIRSVTYEDKDGGIFDRDGNPVDVTKEKGQNFLISEGIPENVARDPEQAKRCGIVGRHRARKIKGAIWGEITLFQDADSSTLWHEFAHAYFRQNGTAGWDGISVSDNESACNFLESKLDAKTFATKAQFDVFIASQAKVFNAKTTVEGKEDLKVGPGHLYGKKPKKWNDTLRPIIRFNGQERIGKVGQMPGDLMDKYDKEFRGVPMKDFFAGWVDDNGKTYDKAERLRYVEQQKSDLKIKEKQDGQGNIPKESAGTGIPGEDTGRPSAGTAKRGAAERSLNYPEAQDREGNPWIKQSETESNAGRTLLVQFTSDLMGKNVDSSSEYYDKLYSGVRPGYARLKDFWEIPQWIGQIANTVPNSDVYIVRDMEDAKAFVKESGYDNIAFSSLDVTIPLIKELAPSFPGKVIIGGYANPEAFKGLKHEWHDSVRSMSESLGYEYEQGTDYKHFKGSKVIPRLTMSQGCKYKCAFCTVPKTLDVSSQEFIDQQVDSFKDLDARLVYLNDKTFGQANNYQYLSELNTKMKAQNPNFEGFIIQTTAADFNRMPTEWLQKSGIKYVELGVESYNDFILKSLHKPHNEAIIDKAAQKIRDLKMDMVPNIIIGIPEETEETYQRTLDFLEANKDIISHANIYNLALYEGTEITKKLGIQKETDLDENVREKSFHKDETIHDKFAEDVFGLMEGQLEDQEISAEPADFKIRAKNEPKKTITAYKLFEQRKGKLYPLFINKNTEVPVGVWVDGQNYPTKGYAQRPGWHSGPMPTAPHLMKKDGTLSPSRVWAQIELPADKSWQEKADASSTKDIKNEVPVNGYYRFKTNKMQGGAWYLSGSMKIIKVLSPDEVNNILAGENIPETGAPKIFRDKQVTLTHWSKLDGLKKLDPKMFGTAHAGAEKSRILNDGSFLNRTFYGVQGYKKEWMLGSATYTAKVDGNKLYDIENDYLKLFPTAEELEKRGYSRYDQKGSINLYEQRIKKAGYDGIYSDAYKVVAMFKPVPVTQTEFKETADYKVQIKPMSWSDVAPLLQRLGWSKERIDGMTEQKKLNFIKLANSIKLDVSSLAKAGIEAKDWYARTAEVFDIIAGKNGGLLADLNAAFSPNATVQIHTTNAIIALEKYLKNKNVSDDELRKMLGGLGLPDSVTRAIQAFHGERLGTSDITGNKVRSFAANTKRDYDPITLDVYMTIAYGLGKYNKNSGVISYAIDADPTYSAVAVNLMRLADSIGLKPAEAQAAVWTTIKVLHEKIADEKMTAKEAIDSLTFGDIANSGDTSNIILDSWGTGNRMDKALKNFGVTQEQIDSIKPFKSSRPDVKIINTMTPQEVKELRKFGDAVALVTDQRAAVSGLADVIPTLNFETVSLRDANADILSSMPYEIQEKMHNEIMTHIDKSVEHVAKKLDLVLETKKVATGSWAEGENLYSNPSSLYGVLKGLKHTIRTSTSMNALSAYLGYVNDQAGVGWTRAIAPKNPNENQPVAMVDTKTGEPLSREDIIALQMAMSKYAKIDTFYLAPHAKGVYIVNIGVERGVYDNDTFAKDYKNAIKETIKKKVARVRVANNGGNYIGAETDGGVQGDGYRSILDNGGGTGFFGDYDLLRSEIRDIKERYAQEHRGDLKIKYKGAEPVRKQVAEPTQEPKTSKIAKRLAEDYGLFSADQRFAEYIPRNIQEQSEMVAELMDDKQMVHDIINGYEPMPHGMSASMFIAGVNDYVATSGDYEMAYELVHSKLLSETSIHASELRLMREISHNEVVLAISQIAAARMEVAKEKNPNIEKEVKKQRDILEKEAIAEIQKVAPTKSTLDRLFDLMSC